MSIAETDVTGVIHTYKANALCTACEMVLCLQCAGFLHAYSLLLKHEFFYCKLNMFGSHQRACLVKLEDVIDGVAQSLLPS